MSDFSWFKKACAVFVVCAATAITTRAQVFSTLAWFDGADGAGPPAALIQGPDGNFYGSTYHGQLGNCYDTDIVGCGTIFRVTPDGRITTLHSFCADQDCNDGALPDSNLLLTIDGDLYGTTSAGGVGDCTSGNYAPGCGTIFKLSHEGVFTTLYRFCTQTGCPDGEYPYAGLIQATDGNLYGTTAGGGAGTCAGAFSPPGCGTIFRITPGGAFTTLYRFCMQAGCPDGAVPLAGLLEASDGYLYGTARDGGENGAGGTIFKISLSGELTTVYSFSNGGPIAPAAGLMQAADGELYGTTSYGGPDNAGTVFKVTLNGILQVLANFNDRDGAFPFATLIQATDGNFYGATGGGGNGFGNHDCLEGCGAVFEIASKGKLTDLHLFCSEKNCTDGAAPGGGQLQATSGLLYGTSQNGGRSANRTCGLLYGCGTVYTLDMGLGPFVSFVLPAGKAGQTGGILGQGFTGTTSVSLNGTPASFTVVSDTFIKATVPAGATTGYVTVTTPTGVLTSNVPFHVIP
jgi:uncharacterized repeat protein (TIGR03803 family)